MLGIAAGVAYSSLEPQQVNPSDIYPTVKEQADKKRNSIWFEYLRSNLALRVLLIFGLWLLTGILFYKYTQGWTFYNAYFYCINAGFSIGFGNITEIDFDHYHAFTIAFVLLGSSIVSGAIGYLLSFLIFNNNTNAPTTYTFDTVNFGDGSMISCCKALWYKFKYMLGWYTNRGLVKTVLLFTFWMGLGVAYGMTYERWTFIQSLFYAITSSSTGGLYGIRCLNPSFANTYRCDLGFDRAMLSGMFCMFGVPIYAFTMGQFAAIGISYAAQNENKKKLYREITLNEFNFACKILSSSTSTTLTMGEFILMEFIRLGCIDAGQIDTIKAKFKLLDTMHKGELSLENLLESKTVILDKHSAREGVQSLPNATSGNSNASTRLKKATSMRSEDELNISVDRASHSQILLNQDTKNEQEDKDGENESNIIFQGDRRVFFPLEVESAMDSCSYADSMA